MRLLIKKSDRKNILTKIFFGLLLNSLYNKNYGIYGRMGEGGDDRKSI